MSNDARKRMAESVIANPYLRAFDSGRLRSYLNGVQDPSLPGQATSYPGLAAQGNIDLLNRPALRNADGSVSTTRSFSFQDEDGKETLIPQIADDGSRILSQQEAIDQYRKTGRFLGKFDSPEQADAYANWLHNQQVAGINPEFLNPTQ